MADPNLRQQLSTAEEALQQASEGYFDIEQKHDSISAQYEALSNSAKSLQDGKMELAQMLERKKEEVARLKETINSIQSFNAQNEATTLNSSQNDIKIKEIEFSFKDQKSRLDNGLKMYNDQIQQLIDAELLKLQKETSVNMMQANIKIEQQANEISRLKNAFKKTDEDISEIFKLYHRDFDSQKQVIYKLLTNITELRDLVKKGVEAHSALEAEFNAMKESYLNDVTELEAERAKLIEELEKSKQVASEFTKRCIEKEFQKTFPLVYESRELGQVITLEDLYYEMQFHERENASLKSANEILLAEREEEKKQKRKQPDGSADGPSEAGISSIVAQHYNSINNKDISERAKSKIYEREVTRVEDGGNELTNELPSLSLSVSTDQSDLRCVNETLPNNALVEAEESATKLLRVVMFLREEKAQLDLKMAKLGDEHSCIKIQVENIYKKAIETLESVLEVKKQSTSRKRTYACDEPSTSNLKKFKVSSSASSQNQAGKSLITCSIV